MSNIPTNICSLALQLIYLVPLRIDLQHETSVLLMGAIFGFGWVLAGLTQMSRLLSLIGNRLCDRGREKEEFDSKTALPMGGGGTAAMIKDAIVSLCVSISERGTRAGEKRAGLTAKALLSFAA